ncbi:hypothetical protein [Streptomyces rubradiris]|uniref:Uncharacterized protein n=1 Tax=Streptomyces rubradiris TaxID=285531 RepID=A0ABQ3R8B4_STRRR|nr:hypothetical protein [Streptomyces rubradiris]GHH22992.1 hypothetical protein GCM10018792_59140 [Streptomyces rubradiris]GHI52094.1 hypothetical protein Srubr_19400 [Streptomyces rubradiris]
MHVFTGRADGRSTTVQVAHEVYDQARAAQQAALDIPSGRIRERATPANTALPPKTFM